MKRPDTFSMGSWLAWYLTLGVVALLGARGVQADQTPVLSPRLHDPAPSQIAEAIGLCVPLVSDMVLWLPGDGTAVDVFDHSLSFPSANYSSGFTGQAFLFDGSNEVVIDNAPDLNLSKFTIEAWVYPTGLDGSVDIICNKESGGSLEEIQYEIGIKGPIFDAASNIPPGNLAFHLGGLAQLTPDYLEWVDMRAQAPLNKWTHVALTVDPNAVLAYVNGRETRRIILSSPENVRVTSGSLRVGSRSPASTIRRPQDRFNGKIDELALFSRVLTPEEVTRIVQAADRGKCSRNIRTAFRGERIANAAQPYSQQVQVFVEGSGADNVQVTTTLPPGTTVLSTLPSLGTVTPAGNKLVWTLGNVSGTTNHTLDLQLQTSEPGFHQLRSDVSYVPEVGDHTGDDTAIVGLLVTLADDCAEVSGVVARWRAENNMLDSVGNHHGQLINTPIFSSYFTNGPTCRAVYFNGNGGGAYIDPTPDLEFKDGDDFTIESWIRVDTGAAAYTGNLVLLDHRSPPTDKYLSNPDGSFVYWPDGSRRIEGELSIGYLFSLFRQGNEQNGRWILECQLNSRERYFAGLINTNIRADLTLSPTLEDPSLPQQRWNHVAVSVKRGDPAGGGFFVNGRRVGTFDTTPFEGDLTPTNAVPIRLGLHARDGYFRYQYKGAMDNMAIYRRALTDADIAKVYQSGVEGACCRNLGVSIANPPLVSVQSPFEARIRVARTGGRPPRSIVVTNEIPPGLTLLSATTPSGTVTNIGQQVIWTVGDLDPIGDESVSLRLRLITAETNTFRITAVVGYSGEPDDEPSDDHAESVIQSFNMEPQPNDVRVAVAIPQVVNGFVVGATITDGGFGYTNSPNVVIVGGNGSGATATATVVEGVVTGIIIMNAGRGYTGTPTFVIDPPPFPPTQAQGIATLVNGFVTEVVVTNGGHGYGEIAPPVNFIGGGGSGARGVATVQNGVVTGVIIIATGSGYSTPPKVLIAAPSGVPSLGIEVSQVRVNLKLIPGYNYKIQTSSNGSTWTDTGTPFLAMESTASQLFDVTSSSQLFRVVQVP